MVLQHEIHEGRPYAFAQLEKAEFTACDPANNVTWSCINGNQLVMLDAQMQHIGNMTGGMMQFLRPGQVEQHYETHLGNNAPHAWKRDWVDISPVVPTQSDASWLYVVPESDLMDMTAASDVVSMNMLQPDNLHARSTVIYAGCISEATSTADALRDVLKLLKMTVELEQPPEALVILTSDSQAVQVHSSEGIGGWKKAGMCGLVRSVRNEQPELGFYCVDLAVSSLIGDVACRIEPEVAQRGNFTYGQRLVANITPDAITCTGYVPQHASYHGPDFTARAVDGLLNFLQHSNFDGEQCRVAHVAQEALAQQYLYDAIMKVPLSRVRHDHHRKLWKRWSSYIPPEPQVTYKDVLTCSGDSIGQLKLLTR